MTAQLSAYCLVGLLDVFGFDDGADVRQRVLDIAAEEFGAEIVGIVCGGAVIGAVGLGGDRAAERALLDAVAAGQAKADIGGLGPVHLAALPIDGDDRTRFALARAAGPFEPDELRLCRAMVRIMRLAVRTIAAFDEQRDAARRLEAEVARNRELAAELHDRHTDLVGRMLDIQDKLSSPAGSVLATLTDQGGALFPGDVVAVQLLDDVGALRLRHVTANAGPTVVAALDGAEALPVAEQAIGANALAMDDLGDTALGVGAAMSAPIHQRQRSIGAVTVLSSAGGRRFSRDERETLLLLAGYASVAVNDAVIIDERQQALEQAEWQATHDALTGLANRRLVLETIDRRLAAGHRVAVVYLDVDRFKSVNDLHGHQVGDVFLRALAGRLQEVTRPTDLVGRLSGDDVHRGHRRAAGRRRDDPGGPAACRRHGRDHRGRRPGHRSHRERGGRQQRWADGRRPADQRGRCGDVPGEVRRPHRTGVFDGELQTRIRRRAALAECVETAATTGAGLHVVYQPIVDIDTRQVCGHEALLRLHDPTLGPVGPDEFIPLAEELGVVAAIDNWVLSTAMAEAAAAGVTTTLSINVSPTWLINPSVAEHVAAEADRCGFPADRLSVEVTERVALAGNVTATLHRLRQLGVRVLLDDFGTGYSSLAYIRTLEIDGIKIDRAFLADVETDRHRAAILEAIITLTDRLGAQAIAEGVECESQAEALRTFGCRLAQGFLYGRPARGPAGLTATVQAGPVV